MKEYWSYRKLCKESKMVYDYVVTEFELTEEEQERANATRRLLHTQSPALSGGNRPGPYARIKQGALEIFQQKLLQDIMERIGGSRQLPGSWMLTTDCKKIVVCHVQQIL